MEIRERKHKTEHADYVGIAHVNLEWSILEQREFEVFLFTLI